MFFPLAYILCVLSVNVSSFKCGCYRQDSSKFTPYFLPNDDATTTPPVNGDCWSVAVANKRVDAQDPAVLVFSKYNDTVESVSAGCELVKSVEYDDYTPTTTTVGVNSLYDYIIVGAGSSGSVIASGLANSGYNVLMLEAGGEATVGSRVPNLFGQAFGSRMDWQFTGKSNSCLGQIGGTCKLPAGKAIGGSSAINLMYYTRGYKEDYDRWESEFGAEGINWSLMSGHFMSTEKLISETLLKRRDVSNYHGLSGNLLVNDFPQPPSQQLLLDTLIDAFAKTKNNPAPFRIDINNPNVDKQGFFRIQGTLTEKNRRNSVDYGFIKRRELATKVKISRNSLVTKINFSSDKQIPVATGVTFTKGGKDYTVECSKQVILTAGSLKTPQLLAVSGVGPKSVLDELKIPVVAYSENVGKNLQDHPISYGLVVSIDNPSGSATTPAVIPGQDENLSYLLNGSGDMGGIGILSNTVFMRLFDKNLPDVQFLFSVYSPGSARNVLPFLGYNTDLAEAYGKLNVNKTLLGIYPVVLRPKSSGYVQIKSSNVLEDQEIELNYLEHADDLNLMLGAVRFVQQELLLTDAMVKVNATMAMLDIKVCTSKFEKDSDDYWKCVLKYCVKSNYHRIGTCAMNKVINTDMNVIGVDGLIVGDNSAFPSLPSCHTNAPTVAFADLVLNRILIKNNNGQSNNNNGNNGN